MKYLLDTNVLCEPARPVPDANVVRWLRAQSALEYGISVLTLGELEKGAALMAKGRRRAALERWIGEELPAQFAGRILPVDLPVSVEWGRLSADGRKKGRPLPVIDGLLLATAATHELTLVTRNEADCAGRGIDLLNPWNA